MFNDYTAEAHNAGDAKRIYDELRGLRGEGEDDAARRWALELLQNAHDVETLGPPFRVEIELTEGPAPTLRFAHTAAPFDSRSLQHLVIQQSPKVRGALDDPTLSTGRFGTGFITTYLLSTRLNLSGVVKDDTGEYRPMDLLIDRSGALLPPEEGLPRLKDEIRSLTQRVLRLADHPPVSAVPGAINTTFTYHLDPNGIRVAEAGLQNLALTLPYVLAFNPRIAEVALGPGRATYRVVGRQQTIVGDVQIERVSVAEQTEGHARTHTLMVAVSGAVSVALPVEPEGGVGRLLPLDPEMPRLFCAYPLMGSAKMNWPFVVNSRVFAPNVKRSGLIVRDVTDREARHNRALLVRLVDLYPALVRHLIGTGWRDTVFVALVPKPAEQAWLDMGFIDQSVLNPLRIRTWIQPVVETAAGTRSALQESQNVDKARIPAGDEATRAWIWETLAPFRPSLFPVRKHLDLWYRPGRPLKVDYTVESLVRFIAATPSLDLLHAKLTAEVLPANWTPEKTRGWLLGVLRHLDKDPSLQHFLRNVDASGKAFSPALPVLPDQKGVLRRLSELVIDATNEPYGGEAAEDLKNLLARLGPDVRSGLLDRDVALIAPGHAEMTIQALAGKVADAAREKIAAGAADDEMQEAFDALYLWLTRDADRRKALFPDFPVSKLRDERAIARDIEKAQAYDAQQSVLQAHGVTTVEDLAAKLVEAERLLAGAQAQTTTSENPSSTTGAALVSLMRLLIEKLEAKPDHGYHDLAALMLAYPELFHGVSEHTVEALRRFIEMLAEAKMAVYRHLEADPRYNVDGWPDGNPVDTVVQGVKRVTHDGGTASLTLVIRPSHGYRIHFYGEEERLVMSAPSTEIWIAGPDHTPQHLTLGKLVEWLDVDRLPLRAPALRASGDGAAVAAALR